MSIVGDAALAYLPAYLREADDGTLAALFAAIGHPVDYQAEVCTSAAASADEEVITFNRLGWLAALAGIDLSTVPDASKRAVTADPDWRFRGSATAIQLRVGLTLTGSKTVLITSPYSGSADRILVQTFTAETPDTAATEAAVRAEVPAWMRLTYQAIAGQTYSAMAADYATYGDMTTTGKTYSTLASET